MVCRLEKQRKHLGNVGDNSTVFDKMFSDNYYSKHQTRTDVEETTHRTNDNMNEVRNKKKSDSVAGTIHYMAPEVINREECNEKIDWWSCGVLFYYCVVGKKLFDRKSKHLLVREILGVDIDEILQRSYQIPADLRNLMSNMLIRDVDKRFSSEEIRNHAFFQSVGNISKGAVKKVFDPMSTCKLKNNFENKSSNMNVGADSADDQLVNSGWSHLPSEARLRNRWSMRHVGSTDNSDIF